MSRDGESLAGRLLCRICGASLKRVFANLRSSPLANAYLAEADLRRPESYFPLTVFTCTSCLLVQLPMAEVPEAIFSSYAYFSSYSPSWVEHARVFAEAMSHRLGLGSESLVLEVASNDGYLLQHFRGDGIPVLGIDPAANVAEVATQRGIPTRVEFFGSASARKLAGEGVQADLLVANNVLAHVPEVVDFVDGLKVALAPSGVVSVEFPHIARLIEHNQFDTIYHEHYSYFSFGVVQALFARAGLTVFDVEELPTHGGSLRVLARHSEEASPVIEPSVQGLLDAESAAGLDRVEGYDDFEERAREVKRQLLDFLIAERRAGRSVVAYGAAAKGNTLLNYCGVGTDLIDYVVDRSPHKQGLYLPGSRLPIHDPSHLEATRPDTVLILPWNLAEEIVGQMAHVREWGGRFCVAVPSFRMLG